MTNSYKDICKEAKQDRFWKFESALLELGECILELHPKQPLKIRVLLRVIEWVATKTAYSTVK